MDSIRRCRADEQTVLLHIINSAAQKYRAIIPDDCWHDPYMSAEALTREIDAGVEFWGFEAAGGLAGIMGVQAVLDVALIRHAYVLPSEQGRGAGSRLLTHICAQNACGKLVGTWAAARWAIGFYERHGFALVDCDETPALLRKYWTIADRQIETSVVLAKW